jgi:hypothetical protein
MCVIENENMLADLTRMRVEYYIMLFYIESTRMRVESTCSTAR